MPEFILDRAYCERTEKLPSHPFYGLSEFAKGYVEAMFFTNGDTGEEQENLLNDLGVERLTRASVAKIRDDCRKFQSTLMADGCFVRQWIDRLPDIPARYGEGVCDDRRAGHMFWYARQGHGVSWSDDYESCDTAEGLQQVSQSFGESYVEVYRGWIHVR